LRGGHFQRRNVDGAPAVQAAPRHHHADAAGDGGHAAGHAGRLHGPQGHPAQRQDRQDERREKVSMQKIVFLVDKSIFLTTWK
jgi:hypothetical protein